MGLSSYEQTVKALSLCNIYSRSGFEEKGSVEADPEVRVEETVDWELKGPSERELDQIGSDIIQVCD